MPGPGLNGDDAHHYKELLGQAEDENEKLKGLLRRYARTEDGYCVACGILVGWGHENDCELFPVIGDVPERSE